MWTNPRENEAMEGDMLQESGREGVVCRKRHGQGQVVELGRKRVSCIGWRCLLIVHNACHKWRSVNTTPFVSSWADEG